MSHTPNLTKSDLWLMFRGYPMLLDEAMRLAARLDYWSDDGGLDEVAEAPWFSGNQPDVMYTLETFPDSALDNERTPAQEDLLGCEGAEVSLSLEATHTIRVLARGLLMVWSLVKRAWFKWATFWDWGNK
jgi:hypothetical protein